MKKSKLRQDGLAKLIATTLIGISVMLGGASTALSADATNPKKEDYMQPTAEDLETYLRPLKVPQGENNTSTAERIELGKTVVL